MNIRRAPLGEILHLQRRAVTVVPDQEYREIGVRSFGRGLFVKEPVSGIDLGEKRVFWIREGDLVVSNVFAWEGAVGVARAEHAGLIGSHRFMTWTLLDTDVSIEYLHEYLRSREGLAALGRMSPGSAGRNRTLSIRGFEGIEVPVPRRGEQDLIADHLKTLEGQLVESTQTTLFDSRRMLPRLIGEILRTERLPAVALGELSANRQVVIHPGEPLQGADAFVGLEHIESHSGQRIGDRPIANESGRKLLFRPGQVTYGYLRPYLNKAWVADRTGLCSVEQFVLHPTEGVLPELLSLVLRSDLVWEAAKKATNGLQLPRLSLAKLLSFAVPDVRTLREPQRLLADASRLTGNVLDIAGLRSRRGALSDAVLPAARNEIFAAMA